VPGVVPEVSNNPEPMPSGKSEPSYKLTALAPDALSAILLTVMPELGAKSAFVNAVVEPEKTLNGVVGTIGVAMMFSSVF
jgi:hypothetical protein